MALPAAEACSAVSATSPEGAASASAPASARSQRGKPPENRRGTPLPLGAVAGRLPAARGGISVAVGWSSRGFFPPLGTGVRASAGFFPHLSLSPPRAPTSRSL